MAGVRGLVTEIAADPLYLDVQLEPGAVLFPTHPGRTHALVYLFQGGGMFGADAAESLRMLILTDGDELTAQAGGEGMRFMLMAGAPFHEPIAPYGPFVMNTREEIQQALVDLRNGTLRRGRFGAYLKINRLELMPNRRSQGRPLARTARGWMPADDVGQPVP